MFSDIQRLVLTTAHDLLLGNVSFPADFAAAYAPWRLYWVGTPSIRCVELMFLTSVI